MINSSIDCCFILYSINIKYWKSVLAARSCLCKIAVHGPDETFGVLGRGDHRWVLSTLHVFVYVLYLLHKVVRPHEIYYCHPQPQPALNHQQRIVYHSLLFQEVCVFGQICHCPVVYFRFKKIGVAIFVNYEICVESCAFWGQSIYL